MKKVGIVACSNGISPAYEKQILELQEALESAGTDVMTSDCIYAKDSVFPGSVKERADQLMKLYKDSDVGEIYDVSGGDIANQILDHLDFDVIRKSNAIFWGYSDLSTILNAIYTMTGKAGVLYQVRNMVRGDYQEIQRDRFVHREKLFDPSFEFLSGNEMEGIVVGGNIRCFLKLAGTRYFPDLEGKVLLLEAWGGRTAQLATYLAQLKQLGAFEKVKGILLGTFTELEEGGGNAYDLVRDYAGNLPVARTSEIGHGHDAKAIWIGKEIFLSA